MQSTRRIKKMREKFKLNSPGDFFVRMAGLSLLVVAASIAVANMSRSPVTAEGTSAAVMNAQETGKAFAEVTKQVAPAVVFIQATKQPVALNGQQDFGDLRGQIPEEMLRHFFGGRLPQMPAPQPSVGAGSGFIISEDGYILTNNHVVGDTSSLEVTLQDGRKFDAEVVGADARTDVAIIKIDGDDLPVLPLGDSDAIEVGEWVLAVGSPFGLSGTVTTGIISAKGRSSMGITDYEDFLQTDAAINPGNSGGPLINLRGEVVGINTAIASRTGAYNGIGFAIPINMANAIRQQLIDNGRVTRGYLGVVIQQLTPDLADSFGVEGDSGVLIGEVTPDGPAGKAGLKQGDVIVEMDGKPVEKMAPFRNRVAMVAPGSKVELEVLRDGARKTFNVQVGELPNNPQLASARKSEVESLGLGVQDLDEQLAAQLGLEGESGIVVTSVAPGSQAARQGIRTGSLIKEVNRTPVKNVNQFRKILSEHKGDQSILLLVQDGSYSRYVVLKLKDA
jgi:serine protease Do